MMFYFFVIIFHEEIVLPIIRKGQAKYISFVFVSVTYARTVVDHC